MRFQVTALGGCGVPIPPPPILGAGITVPVPEKESPVIVPVSEPAVPVSDPAVPVTDPAVPVTELVLGVCAAVGVSDGAGAVVSDSGDLEHEQMETTQIAARIAFIVESFSKFFRKLRCLTAENASAKENRGIGDHFDPNPEVERQKID